MDLKALGQEMLVVAKPKLKEAMVEVVDKVINPKVVDPGLDYVKAKIPGVWDDAIVEANRPMIKDAVKKFFESL